MNCTAVGECFRRDENVTAGSSTDLFLPLPCVESQRVAQAPGAGALLRIRRRHTFPELVELERVEERDRLDDLVLPHREEPRVGVLVRFPVPSRCTSIEEDDDCIAI